MCDATSRAAASVVDQVLMRRLGPERHCLTLDGWISLSRKGWRNVSG
jgi:hypothetical protein